jgi:hypothetical protein
LIFILEAIRLKSRGMACRMSALLSSHLIIVVEIPFSVIILSVAESINKAENGTSSGALWGELRKITPLTQPSRFGYNEGQLSARFSA